MFLHSRGVIENLCGWMLLPKGNSFSIKSVSGSVVSVKKKVGKILGDALQKLMGRKIKLC